MTATDAIEPRTDPRVARTREAVLAAGRELLVEHGVRGITVDGISRRTGVAKTTIYRHWPSKGDLVVAIVADQAFAFPPPDGDDDTDYLRRCLRALSSTIAEPEHRITLLGVLELAARDASLASVHGGFLEARVAPLIPVMSRLVAAGALPPDADLRLTVELMIGPIVLRALFFGEAVSDEDIERLVERAIGTPAAGPTTPTEPPDG